MAGILIDERGAVWAADSRDLARYVGSVLRDADVVSFCVWKLGFVHLRPLRNGLLIEMQPNLTGRVSLISAFYEVFGRRPERVVLRHEPTGSMQEILPEMYTAFLRMEELIKCRGPSDRPGMRADRRPLDDLGEVADGRMVEAFRMWTVSDHQWSPELFGAFSHCSLIDYANIIRQPAGSNRLVIDHWGRKRTFLGGRWARSAIGQEIEDQPCSYLVPWTAATYRESLSTAEPHLYSTMMRILTDDNKIRRKYSDRLLLPFTGADGERIAVSVSIDRVVPDEDQGRGATWPADKPAPGRANVLRRASSRSRVGSHGEAGEMTVLDFSI